MADNPYVYAGAKAPEALSITITPELTGTPLDLSTVTACSLEVRKKNAPTVFWDTVISSQNVNQLVVIHEFADDRSDVPKVGELVIFPHLTVPGGTRRSSPFYFDVIDRPPR